MKINAIDEVLSEEALTEIKQQLTNAKIMMPFLLSLTAKERQRNYKLSNKRFDFLNKVIMACKNQPEIIPNWVSLEEMENDYQLSSQLQGIENMLESLLSEVRDTRMQLGCEALKSASDVYAQVGKAKDRIPGVQAIYDSLKESYPGRGKTRKKSEPKNDSGE